MADVHMRALFDEDPVRVSRFSLEDAGLYLDYSKNRIVTETLRLLHDLAHTARLGHAIERMFADRRIASRTAHGHPCPAAIVLSLGMEVFERLLDGAYRMDRHFRSAPLEANLPVVLGLLSLWYTDFFGARSRAVIPYDQHLEYLPAYLQQLEMESNGKGVTLSGSALDYSSAPVVWGAPGTNGQHAFFQLLHQGTLLIPVDFLMAWHGHHPPEEQHELLVANCIAQSQALMRGRSAAEVGAEMRARGVPETEVERLVPHRVCPGNRPSDTLCYERLTPETLGALIALYEHKTFTEGVILGIDSFDQWGVELGKTLAGEVAAGLRGQIPIPDQDSSTRRLIERYRRRARDVPEPPSTG